MLYPKEDRANNKLEFACRTCEFREEAATSCVFRNELRNTVGETAGITQDVGQDPTVGLSNIPDFCTLCGNEIFCEVCGQETDRGLWLEVEDDENEPTGYETPTSQQPTTPQELHTSQQLQRLNLHNHEENRRPTDSQKQEEAGTSSSTTSFSQQAHS
jgi:DNA-directed RNA polymerase II subunit RPB9